MPADPDRSAQQRATWLPRLANAAECVAAADALQQIEFARVCEPRGEKPKNAEETPGRSRRDIDADYLDELSQSLQLIDDQIHSLVPNWIARLLEFVADKDRPAKERSAAGSAGGELPAIDFKSIFALRQVTLCLCAVGPKMDPFLNPIVDALGKFGREGDENLATVLERAGPAVRNAVPALLQSLKTHRIWCWPSHLTNALVNASRHDAAVVPQLRALLEDPDPEVRSGAINVLGKIGPDALSTAPQLLAFRNGDENERCTMLSALANQGATGPEYLDVYDEALRDPNGYVRRAAAWSVGSLKIEPERFVPLLVDCLDWKEYLHDTTLPEAAAAALAEYGPAAAQALPRLRRFLDGPIEGRTLEPKHVVRAIERISENPLPEPITPAPARRTEPPTDDEPLFPVIYQSKQCYIDREGRLVIQTSCGWGHPFSCGRAIVRYDDKERSFVIDRRGEVVFEIQWEDMKPYSEGLAAVQKDGKWGFVDPDGRVVIEPQFDSVTAFSEGLAGFELGRTERPLFKSASIKRTAPGPRGYIDRTGKHVIAPHFNNAGLFRDGRALVSFGGELKPNEILDGELTLQDESWGYIDVTGKVVIAAPNLLSHSFQEGRAVITTEPHPFRLQYGYIDVDGHVIVPQILNSATPFKDGLATVKYRGRPNRSTAFVIDKSGEKVAAIPLESVDAFSEGLAAASPTGAYDRGYVDLTGRFVIPPQFDIVHTFKNGLASVQRGEWHALINTKGVFVWGPTPESFENNTSELEWT